MTSPVIGLTTYRTRAQMTSYDDEHAVVPAQYIDAITRAGGSALLLAPQPITAERARQLIGLIDGLIIAGGEDVNPQRYGQRKGPHTEDSVDLRDDFEDALLAAALAVSLPVLGICRGAQLMNVHCGGTLHQHLPDVIGHSRYSPEDGSFAPEEITVSAGSRISEIFSGEETVTGYVGHHQAIDQLGRGLRVTARGFDGVIQAIEIEGHPFGLAVQWHPEENLADNRLVEALVRSARA